MNVCAVIAVNYRWRHPSFTLGTTELIRLNFNLNEVEFSFIATPNYVNPKPRKMDSLCGVVWEFQNSELGLTTPTIISRHEFPREKVEEQISLVFTDALTCTLMRVEFETQIFPLLHEICNYMHAVNEKTVTGQQRRRLRQRLAKETSGNSLPTG